jgi:hypothetical protein
MRKKLKVFPFDTPWTALRSELTGDEITDRKLIRDFCSRHGVSAQTATARMNLFTQTAPIEQSRNIRSGRA